MLNKLLLHHFILVTLGNRFGTVGGDGFFSSSQDGSVKGVDLWVYFHFLSKMQSLGPLGYDIPPSLPPVPKCLV